MVSNFYQPANSFVSMILFISFMEITISSKTGTLPPTRPVFPLWGHTANRLSLQNFNMADTSSVVFGFNTSVLFPVSNSFQRQAIYYVSALTLFFCSIHYTRQFASETYCKTYLLRCMGRRYDTEIPYYFVRRRKFDLKFVKIYTAQSEWSTMNAVFSYL